MKRNPQISTVEDASDGLFERGHLWLQESIDGGHLRFRLERTGAIRFGDRDRTFEPDDVPFHYRHAVRRIRDRLDRDALDRAVPDVESIVFFGVAPFRRRIDYDWERTPAFLGFGVWSTTDESFLPPDTVEKIFERLGLRPLPAIRKEVRAVDFDPDGYEFPDSKWYDGPAAGVIVRNKRCERAVLPNETIDDHDVSAPVVTSSNELVDRYVTDDRLASIAARLEEQGWPVTPDGLYERVIEDVGREVGPRPFEGQEAIDLGAFRSAVAARTGRYLDDRA